MPRHRNELPRFIILGAQKAGTTSLFNYISKHPQVNTQHKEVHYFFDRFNTRLGDFSLDDLPPLKEAQSSGGNAVDACTVESGACGGDGQSERNKRRAEAVEHHLLQYRAHFPIKIDHLQGQITGEAAPYYLLYGDVVIPRMRAALPDAKLIVLLREPTQRVISAVRMIYDEIMYAGGSPPPLSSVHHEIEEEMKSIRQMGITANSSMEDFVRFLPALREFSIHPALPIVSRGLYVLQLRLWLTYWPPEQILVVPMSRIWLDKRQPFSNSSKNSNGISNSNINSTDSTGKQKLQGTLDAVFQFLGLPSYPVADVDSAIHNAGKTKFELAEDTVTLLDEFYAPFNEALFELLGSRSVW